MYGDWRLLGERHDVRVPFAKQWIVHVPESVGAPSPKAHHSRLEPIPAPLLGILGRNLLRLADRDSTNDIHEALKVWFRPVIGKLVRPPRCRSIRLHNFRLHCGTPNTSTSSPTMPTCWKDWFSFLGKPVPFLFAALLHESGMDRKPMWRFALRSTTVKPLLAVESAVSV